MKMYIVGEGEGVYFLITEEGEGLANHFCSNASFARHNLEGGRPERQKEWKKEFGDYEVLYIGDDEMTKDELIKRNKEF